MKQLAPRKADWKNHFAYHYLVYIIGCVAACLVWSLLFSVSKPETPMNKRVELFFVGLHDYNEADAWATGISGHLGEDQEVSYLTVPEPDAVMEETSSSVMLFTHMSGKSGDLMFLPYDWFEYLASDGALIPLTTTGETGQVLLEMLPIPAGVDMDYGYAAYTDPDTNEQSVELCGVPIGHLSGFRDLGIDPIDMVACVPFYCENRENAMRALAWIMEHKGDQTDEYWYPLDTPWEDEENSDTSSDE